MSGFVNKFQAISVERSFRYDEYLIMSFVMVSSFSTIGKEAISSSLASGRRMSIVSIWAEISKSPGLGQAMEGPSSKDPYP